MQKIKGTVEVVARNKKGVKIGESWYGAFKVAQLSGADAGDVVEFDSEPKGDFNNIKGNVTIVTKGSGGAKEDTGTKSEGSSGGSLTMRDRQIIRQNSLTQANTLLSTFYSGSMGDQGATPEESANEVIAIARMFEAYSSGEI